MSTTFNAFRCFFGTEPITTTLKRPFDIRLLATTVKGFRHNNELVTLRYEKNDEILAPQATSNESYDHRGLPYATVGFSCPSKHQLWSSK